MELTEEHHQRAREFARYLLLHVGPLIDEMQLTRNEVELSFTYLLAESLFAAPQGCQKNTYHPMAEINRSCRVARSSVPYAVTYAVTV
jgi:hypothetical protein